MFIAFVSQISDFYLSRLAALLAFWAALGMSWNLIGGYAGQLSLGHAAFVGLGGYVTLVLQQQFGIVPWIGLFAATFAAALAALFVGVTLRLSGIYFALATLAYPLILQVLFTYWGYQEALIPARPAQPFLYMQWSDNRWYAALFAVILLFCWLAAIFLERSRIRYFLTAIREDEAAAAAVGINTWLVKLWAFVISAGIAGLLGVVYAQMLFVVTPETLFGIGISVQAIIVTLVGGIGYAAGPLLGALIIVPISQALDAKFGSISGASQLVYGLVLIVVVLLIPRGLIDRLRQTSFFSQLRSQHQRHDVGPRPMNLTPPAPVSSAYPLATGHDGLRKHGLLLNAEGISKAYGGIKALRNINLDVRYNEFIGIVGPNGAGKTTLFDILTGFQRPSTGHLRLRQDMTDLSRTSWRTPSAPHFKISSLFGGLSPSMKTPCSAAWFENEKKAQITLAMATCRRSQLQAVRFAQLADKRQTLLVQISRSSFSRSPEALIRNSPISLLDEPIR